MKCEQCHKPIENPKRKQRFCNNTCRSAWHNKRKVLIDKIPTSDYEKAMASLRAAKGRAKK